MTLIVVCSECAETVPADYIADDDGARLFACCSCGEAGVRWDFSRRANGASEPVVHGPPPDETTATDAAVWATVASSSFA